LLFLEQIAPSHAAHGRTCCEHFCRCSAWEIDSEIPEIFDVFGPNSTVYVCWNFAFKSIFAVSYSNLSEVRQYRI